MSSACTSASPRSERRRRLARFRASGALACLLLLAAACAAPEPHLPRLERSPADMTGAGIAPETPRLSLADIESAVRAGATPDAVVQRWRDDGARLPLTAADIVELHGHGVSAAHLDALLAAREQALRTDCESRLAAQRANCEAALAVERAQLQNCAAPYWGAPYWGPFPYAGWGSGGHWYGGLRFGW